MIAVARATAFNLENSALVAMEFNAHLSKSARISSWYRSVFGLVILHEKIGYRDLRVVQQGKPFAFRCVALSHVEGDERERTRREAGGHERGTNLRRVSRAKPVHPQ